MAPNQCRFCHERRQPLITPCNCTGTVKYIHKSCILKWVTMDGYVNHSRMVCPLCMAPYELPQITLETFFTGIRTVDIILYNSMGVTVFTNYMCILYGVHNGMTIPESLLMAQAIVYLTYAYVYGIYARIQNMGLYTQHAYNSYLPVYACIQLCSSYAAFKGSYVLMSMTGLVAHHLLWREHTNILLRVNESLIKND